MDKANLQVIREAFGRVVYTHKTHEKEADLQLNQANWVKWFNIVLIAVTTGSLLGTLFTSNNLLLVGAIASSLNLGFSIFQLSFNPEQKGAKHKQVASSLWLIRERYLCLMTDIISGSVNKADIILRRDSLINDLDLIYKSAPATSNKAYELAREALQINEEFTFTDDELNKFLPTELHFKNNKK